MSDSYKDVYYMDNGEVHDRPWSGVPTIKIDITDWFKTGINIGNISPVLTRELHVKEWVIGGETYHIASDNLDDEVTILALLRLNHCSTAEAIDTLIERVEYSGSVPKHITLSINLWNKLLGDVDTISMLMRNFQSEDGFDRYKGIIVRVVSNHNGVDILEVA